MKNSTRCIVLGLTMLVLILPLIPLLLWSVAWRWDFPALLPDFDLWAWGEIGNGRIARAITVSVPLSLTVVVLALLLSFFPAKILGTSSFRGKGIIEALLLLPCFIPQISVVFGMQSVFRSLGIYSTAAGVVVAQLVFQVPYLTLLLSAVFKAYDVQLEAQAACLGVGKLRTLWHVCLPAVRPGVMVSCVFSFIGSWGCYLLTAVIGPVKLQTLPVVLFPMMSSGNNSYPLIAAVTLIYISPVLLFLALSAKVITGEDYAPGKGGLM